MSYLRASRPTTQAAARTAPTTAPVNVVPATPVDSRVRDSNRTRDRESR